MNLGVPNSPLGRLLELAVPGARFPVVGRQCRQDGLADKRASPRNSGKEELSQDQNFKEAAQSKGYFREPILPWQLCLAWCFSSPFALYITPDHTLLLTGLKIGGNAPKESLDLRDPRKTELRPNLGSNLKYF